MPYLVPAIITLAEPALLRIDALDLIEPIEVPPDPGPGDPATPPTDYVPSRRGLRVQVMLCRVVTHEIVGELRTADADEWPDDLDQQTSLNIPASSFDPMWEAVSHGHVTYRGRRRYQWDAKQYEIMICLEGVPEWVGVFRQPIDIGGGQVILAARSPEALFDDHPLGLPEAADLLGGVGDFEQYPVGPGLPPGWTFDHAPGVTMTAEIVYDGVRGRKCLKVHGQGWVFTPKVPLPGQNGVGRTVGVSAFGKWPDTIEVGVPVIGTKVQRADSLVPSNVDATIRKAGARPDSGSRWSDQPVSSGATMTESSIIHYTWGALRSVAFGDTFYDLVRMQQGILSGFLDVQPYSRYIRELTRDMQDPDQGGVPLGITSRIEEDTTAGVQLTWAHNGHPRAVDCLAMVDTNVDGGAAHKISPAWVQRIRPRFGQDRRDEILLGPDEILDMRWAPDPGAQIEDFIGDTGRGSGTTAVMSVVSQPQVPNRHRISLLERTPAGTLNATDAYTRRHAAVAAREHVTAEVDVRWRLGRQIATGDTVSALLIDGGQMYAGPMKVLRRRMRPKLWLVTMSLGVDE